ncbi:MAG: hypothetical protein ACI4LA_05595 [Emergencia sp.]
MTAEVFLSVVIICGIYVVCELVGKLLHYKIPVLVLFMAVLIIFGGQLHLLPEDMFTTSGFAPMIYSFGLPFVLAGFGTTMSVSSLKSEGKTVATALIAVGTILVLGLIAGFLFMDKQTAIYGAVEVAGGGQAGLIFLTHLQETGGSEKLIALMLCLMNMQSLFGFPLSIVSMRKSMRLRIQRNDIPKLAAVSAAEGTEKKTLFRIPAELKNNFYYVFLMLGIICFLSAKLYALTTLSAYLWYILLGFLFAELGLLEHNCLAKSGMQNMLFSIMFVVVCSAFLTLNLGDVGAVAMNFTVLIAFGIIGCVISGFIVSKIFKVDFFEGFSISIGCMVGYPISQKVTEEALNAVRADCEISDETAQCLHSYYEPKIIISGIVSISLITGLLAGLIVSFL